MYHAHICMMLKLLVLHIKEIKRHPNNDGEKGEKEKMNI